MSDPNNFFMALVGISLFGIGGLFALIADMGTVDVDVRRACYRVMACLWIGGVICAGRLVFA